MTTATSLILIAVGAVLAFATTFTVSGVSIHAIGVILIIVGAIGLAFSLLYVASLPPFVDRHRDYDYPDRVDHIDHVDRV